MKNTAIDFQSLIFEANRCHQPQIGLICLVGAIELYDRLPKTERHLLNRKLYTLWDLYRPDSINSNCGDNNNANNHLHWIFNFQVDQYMELLTRIMHDQKYEQTQNVVRDVLNHFGETHERWMQFKQLTFFQQIQHDIDLSRELFRYMCENDDGDQIPSLSSLQSYGPINLSKDIIVPNPKQTSGANDTRLSIIIPTNRKKSAFKMQDFATEVDDALDSLLAAVSHVTEVCAAIMQAVVPVDRREYFLKTLRWFELCISTDITDDCSAVHINVSCQLSVRNCVFILLFASAVKHKDVETWFANYAKLISKSLCAYPQTTQQERLSCGYDEHHAIMFGLDAVKLQKTRYLGKGNKNAGISTFNGYAVHSTDSSGGTWKKDSTVAAAVPLSQRQSRSAWRANSKSPHVPLPQSGFQGGYSMTDRSENKYKRQHNHGGNWRANNANQYTSHRSRWGGDGDGSNATSIRPTAASSASRFQSRNFNHDDDCKQHSSDHDVEQQMRALSLARRTTKPRKEEEKHEQE